MKKYTAWCSDYNNISGEGQLARKFVKSLKLRKIKIHKPLHSFFLSEYIYPYFGIIILWFFYLQGHRTIYINYLPLWNIPIFLLCPPKTIFGPITGSIQINKLRGLKSFIRYFIFPCLYKLSLYLLKLKNNKVIFATNILNKHTKNVIKKTNIETNFILKNIKIKRTKKKCKKIYDLIVYYRNHENKFFQHHNDLIDKFLKKNKKVIIFGDYYKFSDTKYIGRLSKKNVENYLKLSKYSLSGDDNLLSLFNLQCINQNVKIIYNIKLKFQVVYYLRRFFIPFDYEKKNIIEKKLFN